MFIISQSSVLCGNVKCAAHECCSRDFAFFTPKEKFCDKNSRYLTQQLIARPQLERVRVVRIF